MGKYLNKISAYTGSVLHHVYPQRTPPAENSVRLTTKRFLGIPVGNNIKYGSKKVGFVNYRIETEHYATEADFPADWFVEGAQTDRGGNRLLKPFMWVNELRMKDRLGKSHFVKRDKKYGAMTMKELLKTAQETGCENRIALLADVLCNTGFRPGKFYNKMGFSLTPFEQGIFENLEAKYLEKFAELKKKGLPDEEIKELLFAQGYLKPERVNGRFMMETGRYNLTNPECIINYEV